MKTPRSWLFVPASQPAIVAKALQSSADAVIIDLEDSVPDSGKDEARAALPSLLAQKNGSAVWLRINAHESTWHEQDLLAALALPTLDGILVPKVEKPQALASRHGLSRMGSPGLKQGVLVESARGVLALQGLLAADAAIDMVMFGGAENADLQADLQCSWSPEGIEFMYARQHTLLCARAYQGVLAVDGVYSRLTDADGLSHDTQLSRRLGFRARAAVHPRQLDVINQVYSATDEERARAQKIVAGFDAALEQGRAAVNIDGKLVDYAMYRAACSILDRAPAGHK